MRSLLFVAALCSSCAQAYPTAPRLSGAQLLARFEQDTRYASGYLAGVADAAQGRQW